MRSLVTAGLVFLAGCATEPPARWRLLDTPAECGDSAISLALGASAQPPAGQGRCRIAPSAGAVYALAWLDTRPSVAARTTWEPSDFDSIAVAVTMPGPGFRAARPAAPGAAGASLRPDFLFTGVRDAAKDRDRPWALGERFTYGDETMDVGGPAVVHRIYDGTLVVAGLEAGDAGRRSAVLAQLDSAWPVVRDHALPVLRRTFVNVHPVSSRAAGQLLVMLLDTIVFNGSVYGGMAWASGTAAPREFSSWIYLHARPYFTYVSLAQLLAHELAHAWQGYYMWASSRYGFVLGAAEWGVEGGANFISYETTRRWAGIPLDGNLEWRDTESPLPLLYHAARAQPQTAGFTAGYDNAMGFLRDLALRRMAAGESVDDAVREVSLGAIEGWHGLNASEHIGLTQRMRRLAGEAWSPEGALLDWALSHAGDDRTPNDVYQDRASLRVWDIPVGRRGWGPDGVLQSSAGGTVTVRRRYGSVGYIMLVDEGSGIDAAVASPDGVVAFKILRVQ